MCQQLANIHMLLKTWDYLRYHEDFGEIIDIVGASTFEKALELEILNNVMRLVPPAQKEVEG